MGVQKGNGMDHGSQSSIKKPPPQNSQRPANRPPPVEDEDDEDKPQQKECCKKVLKFMFSHIGLCGMVIAYSVAGGFIFKHLEETNERMECEKAYEKYTPAENDTMNKLWDISASFRNDDDYDLALVEFQKVLQNFRTVVLDLDYDGRNCSRYGKSDGPSYQWSFPGSLLFSVTVITTIGYGNIAPKTMWGRLVCIAYAVLGIPLMLLCLANIGDVLADVFRFVYTKVCCCGCCRRKDKNKVENMQSAKGRKSPEAWKEQYSRAQQGRGGQVVDDDDDDDDDEEDEKISVPLTITMTIISVYIFFGALLFGVWEGWDALTASYFCFVTISTIGFGDIVPGSTNFETATDQWKMVGAAVYMLFGMAILSMCFSLIQEEIVAKFKWVGEKLGIVEKEKDPEDEDDEDEDDEDDTASRSRHQPRMAPPAPRKGTPPGTTTTTMGYSNPAFKHKPDTPPTSTQMPFKRGIKMG